MSNADVSTMTYDAYGNLIDSGGAVQEHDYRYTGKPYDSTGLYYYGARFYDPVLGRFINQDPARDGANWYVYVANNPLRYTDPTGLIINTDDLTPEQKALYDQAIKYLWQSPSFRELYRYLDEHEKTIRVTISRGENFFNPPKTKVFWNPGKGHVNKDGYSNPTSSSLSLAHEFGHAAILLRGEMKQDPWYTWILDGGEGRQYDQNEMMVIRQYETPIAKELGEPTRNKYRGYKEAETFLVPPPKFPITNWEILLMSIATYEGR